MLVSSILALVLAAAAPAERAVAVLHPTQGNSVEGTVKFQAVAGGVKVTANLKGLTPGTHGFHVHEFGDCSAPDGSAAGSHFNPAGHPHAGPKDAKRHAGDLGNIEAGADGTATLDWTDAQMKLDGPTGVIGRGVIVHAKADDLKTQPTGDAGGRLACGVVGTAKKPE
jgi:Cu-Zn family superoxide dismutase